MTAEGRDSPDTDGPDPIDVRGPSGDASARQIWRADADSAGMRVDVFLARRLNLSAGRARQLWVDGVVRIGGRRVAKGSRLTTGDAVELARIGESESPAERGDPESAILPDAALTLAVLYEDPYLVAIDKPAGIPSHPLRPNERGTAANAIVARFPDCAGASTASREGGLGHRLDTGTSGVLIAARSRAAWEGLRRALAAASCEKEYLAEVRGHPAIAEGRVTAAIGRSGRRGGTVRLDGGRSPQPAETRWRIVARSEATALVLARLHRGRAHQVRAHLAMAGFPIVGDDRYGPADSAVAELRLHALSVRLLHPVTGAELRIVAPRPAWAESSRFPG